MPEPIYPSLYQINTRVWLTELSRTLGRPATLDDIPDAELDRLAEMGFDWVWLLSVWQTGPAGQRVSRTNPEWRREFEETLPDLREEDIAGSGFAITGYTVHPDLGGDAALARLRERLRSAGLRLMLDFVPNHTGLDHPWVEDHPEYYIAGTELDLARAPQNYTWVKRKRGDLLLAHGRDPYFPGWPDTLQLNYGNPATQEAMIGELVKIAGQCDGVRCDMAMLVLPEVFERTWGRQAPPFWPRAIAAGAGAGARLPLHGRGVLGPRVDDAAAGLRLRLRQAAVRPAPRGARAARARAPPAPDSITRTGSPGSWKTTTSRGRPRPSLPACTRPPPSSRICRRACGSFIKDSSRAPGSGSRPTSSAGPQEPPDGALHEFYDASPRGAPSVDRARGPVAPARMHAGLGGELDVGMLCRVVLERRGRPATSDGGQLCGQPEPVLRAPPISRAGWPRGAVHGPDGSRPLRSRGE